MQALVSIHDLMPQTMGRVDAILDWLDALQVPPVTLLVVPGKAWEAGHIERLRELADKGHQLAAHGWQHKTAPRKLYHRLHSLILSRDVAEHLDLDSAGVLDLITRSGAWFAENGLPKPEFYVPPAWALGFIHQAHLVQSPLPNDRNHPRLDPFVWRSRLPQVHRKPDHAPSTASDGLRSRHRPARGLSTQMESLRRPTKPFVARSHCAFPSTPTTCSYGSPTKWKNC